MAGNNVEIRITAVGAEQSAAVIKAVGDAGGRIGTVVAAGAKEGSAGLSSLHDHAKRALEIFVGFSTARLFEEAITRAKDFAIETVKLGFEANKIEAAFGNLTKQAGVSGDALVDALQRASGETVNASNIMQASSRGILAGLQPQQLISFMEIARQTSKVTGQSVEEAYNAITTAIANNQPKALKELTLFVDKEAAANKYAAALGKTGAELSEYEQIQSLANAVLAVGAERVKALTGANNEQSESIQRTASMWDDFKESIGKVVLEQGGQALAWAKEMTPSLDSVRPVLAALGTIAANTWTTFVALLKPVVSILVDVFSPGLKDLGAAAVTVFAGMLAAFQAMATPFIGGFTFIASLIKDLSEHKLPSLTKAEDAARAAMLKQIDVATKTTNSFVALATGTKNTAEAADDAEKATKKAALGINTLGQEAGNATPKLKDLTKELAAWVAGINAQIDAQFAGMQENRRLVDDIAKDNKEAADKSLAAWVEASNRQIEAGLLWVTETQRQVDDVERIRTEAAERTSQKELDSFTRTLNESIDGQYAGMQEPQKISDDAAKEHISTWDGVWTSLSGGIGNFVSDFISGTKTATEAFVSLGKSMLNTVVNILADTGVRQLLKFAPAVIDFVGSGVKGLLGFAEGGVVGQAGGKPGAGDTIPALLEAGEMVLPKDLVAKLGEMFGAEGTGGGFFVGLANFASNYAAGGVQGALLGLTPAQQAASLGLTGVEAINAAGVSGTEGLIGAAGLVSGATAAAAALGVALNLGLAIFGGNPTGPSALGTYSGTLAGAGAGAILGTFVFPGIGTVIGGLMGAALGGSLGGLLGGLFGGGPSKFEKTRIEDAAANPVVTNHILDALGMIQTTTDREYTVALLTGGGPQSNPPNPATVRFDGAQYRRAHTHVIDEALDDMIDAAMRDVLRRDYPAGGKTVPFAEGGVVTRPTMALIGEAGPEAVIPLRKMRSHGSTYQINVYALDPASIDARVIDKIVAGIEKKRGRTAMIGSAGRG